MTLSSVVLCTVLLGAMYVATANPINMPSRNEETMDKAVAAAQFVYELLKEQVLSEEDGPAAGEELRDPGMEADISIFQEGVPAAEEEINYPGIEVEEMPQTGDEPNPDNAPYADGGHYYTGHGGCRGHGYIGR